VLTVTLMGSDEVRSIVKMSEDTTVRKVAISKYHLFGQTVKRNGISFAPFATRIVDGGRFALIRIVIRTAVLLVLIAAGAATCFSQVNPDLQTYFKEYIGLELGNGSRDGKDHFSGRSAGIELLGEGNELDALGSEGLKGSQ
jgi:hypothetical protein